MRWDHGSALPTRQLPLVRRRLLSFVMESSWRSRSAQLSLVCMGFASTLPFIQPFHSAPIPTFYSEWIALVLGVIAFALVLLQVPTGTVAIPASALYVTAGIGLVVAHGLVAPTPYFSSTFLWALFLGAGAMIIAAASMLKSYYREEELLCSIARYTLIAGLLAALTQYTLLVLDSSWYSHGLLGQRNHLATYLTLSVTALSYLYAQGRLTATWAIVFAMMLVGAASLTSSRSIFLYFGTLVALCIYYHYRNREPISARLLACSSSALAGLFIIQYLQPTILSFLHIDAAAATALERLYIGGGIQLRLIEWGKALKAFLNNPWFGVGVDQFAWHSYVLHGEPSPTPLKETFTHAHNVFLQLLAEMGVTGLSLILLVIGTWFYSFRKRKLSLETWYISAVLLVLFIHSNLEHPLWYAYFIIIFAFQLGIGDSRVLHIRTSSPKFLRLVGALVLPGAVIYAASTLSAYLQLEKMAAENAHSRQQELYPFYRILLGQIAKNPALTPPADFIKGTMISLDRNDLDSKLELNTRITHWRPVAQNVYRQSVLLALAGRSAESMAYFKKAMSAFPGELDGVIDLLTDLDDPATRPLLLEAKKRRESQASYAAHRRYNSSGH